jgi:hypothetical protein
LICKASIGTLIAACVPSRDPPFVEGRATFSPEATYRVCVKPPEAGPRRYEILAEDGTPVVADDPA